MPEPYQLGELTDERNFLEKILLGEIVSQCLAPLAFLFLVLIIIDGAIPQLEMFLSGGRVPIPTLIIKAGLLGLAILSAIIGRRLKSDLIPIGAWTAFAAYLVLDLPHLMAQHLSIFVVLSEYYGYYSLVLLLPFVSAMSSKMKTREMTQVLMITFWICAAIGLAQHITNSPLLYTKSSDGAFEVISWTLYGTQLIRIFSLFVYSINFGLFCTFIGAIGLYLYLLERKSWHGLLIYIISGLCCYYTLTRVVYLVFLIGTIAVLSLRYGKTAKTVRYCPLLGLSVGALLAYGGTSFLDRGEGISNNLSLLQRIAQFAYYWSVYMAGNVWQKFLGLGYVQDSRVNGEETYPIDNLFLALLLHVGLIGLILFLSLFWAIFQRISAAAKNEPSALKVGVCAVWCSFLAISLFDISVAFFPSCVMLLVLAREPKSPHLPAVLEKHEEAPQHP